MADAVYGSEENDQYVIDTLEKTALIPYNLYHKEQTKRYQRKISVNQPWESYKQQIKEALESESSKRLYGQRKIDVKPVFGG